MSIPNPQEVIQRFQPPVEAMVEEGDPVRVLGIEPYTDSDKELNNLIKKYERQLEQSEFLAVHETTKENAEKIIEEGFDTSFPRTTEQSTFRAFATFFWIHKTDIGYRKPAEGEPYIVFCALVDGHAFVSSYGSINRCFDKPEKYESEEMIFSHTYRSWVSRGVTASPEHSAETLLPTGDER